MSWSKKYKKSIDCNNPKGFSQKAHCAGRKARQAGKSTKSKSVSEMTIEEKLNLFLEKNCPTDKAKWAASKAAAKAKFDVYPCVPLNSMAVTPDGFKSYDELEIGDDILTYNLNTQELEWKPILNLHYYENADLMEIKKPTGFHFKCTPNHKWVIKREFDRAPELIEAKDITTHMRMVFAAKFNKTNSDINLLKENWGKHDTWVNRISKMSASEREIWLSSAIVYDGWEKGKSAKVVDKRTFGFSQKNRDHLLATVYAAYLNGYYVSINDLEKDVVGVTIIRGKDTHGTQNVKKVYLDEKEDVWCPETENQTWVMVQNGWLTITGNSAYANGWAAKNYKEKGGGWRSCSESVNEAGCWEGYKQVGMKEKDGRQVPNCVPVNEETAELNCDENGNCWEAEPPRYQSTSMGYRSMNESDCGCTEQQIKEGSCDCDESIEEYDVETFEEFKSFAKYIREYTQLLSEATCPCLLEAEYRGRTVRLGKIMQGDVKKFKVYVKNPQGNVVKVNFGFGGSSAKGKRMVIKKNNPERRKNFRARHNCDNPGPRWKARYWACRTW